MHQAKRLRECGYTLRRIAEWLTSQSIPTRRNGHWSPEHVRLMLERAKVLTSQKGDEVNGMHPVCQDACVFAR